MATNVGRGREVRQRLMAAAMELARSGGGPRSVREAAVAAIHGLVAEFGDLLDQATTPEDVLELVLRGLER